jgi:hypothetical protein
LKPFRYLLDPLCLAGCIAYVLNRWLIKPHTLSPFLHSHFNDLWLIPCALPPLLWIQRQLRLRTHDQYPSSREIFATLAIWSVLFEIIGPLYMTTTGDPLDIVAYSAGALAAWLWWSQPHEL